MVYASSAIIVHTMLIYVHTQEILMPNESAQMKLCEARYGKKFWASKNDTQRATLCKADSFLDFDHCIRLYDEDGNHILSILRCFGDGGFDIANPDGKVLWADCDAKMIEFWEFLAEQFGIDKINT